MKKVFFYVSVSVFLGVGFYDESRNAFSQVPKDISTPLHIDNIIVHDPHILADPVTKTYYLYGQYSPKREWYLINPPNPRAGVQVYQSKDLVHWTMPQLVFEIPEGFWADHVDAPWAPEVHYYKGKYYLFVTFNDWNTIIDTNPQRPPITKRASQILVSDSPLGPFKPFANKPGTPPGEMTLDATFWVEEKKPYMVYCHEWVQTTDGSIKAIQLSKNLSKIKGKPLEMIRAGQVDWTRRDINYRSETRYEGIVTDGPYLYRSKSGKLILLWSSWSKERLYATSLAYSQSGTIKGPWVHIPEPILQDDIGHGMILETFDGKLVLVIHKYFKQPATRVQIWELEDTGETLRVVKQLYGAP